ncbi:MULTISPECIES: LIC_10190 family membrane protein [unclassified Butyrivibrio]|uniref:LIC_10190 family membrane protein n=1 Tax=unclassified Butyrivibrio TaxID=2639466 RepID=UPI0003FC804E|nr:MULTISPECIES: hypothetical protein [unclassified Butyrivibrio]
MLSVLLNWIYVIVTTYIWGFAILQSVVNNPHMFTFKGKKQSIYEVRYHESYLIAGIIAATSYAQLFSIVYKVGIIANILYIGICLLIVFLKKDKLFSSLTDLFSKLADRKIVVIYAVITLVLAYATSHGLMHYDTDLYHAQAIRWIEEYGVIKGLGNLHLRLGYNSSSFALSALFSMSFMGQSLHTMAGYFALLLAIKCADIVQIVRRRYPILPDFARILAIYYLFTIFDEMVSPASDYYMTTLVFYIVIHWLDLYSIHERSFLPHAFLSMTALYAATIKLSAAPLFLLAIYPIHRLITRRKSGAVRPILYFVLIGFFISFPFVLRSMILTGWLVYPFTAIDIFTVAWKVPIDRAVSDAHEIIAYGRGFTNVADYAVPFKEWFPGWVSSLGTFNKLMLLLDTLCLPVYAGCCIYYMLVGRTSGKGKGGSNVFKLSHRKAVALSDFLFLEGIAYLSLCYWLFSSPLIRYGCVYLWLPAVILIGRFACFIYDRMGLAKYEYMHKAVFALFVLFITYKSIYFGIEDARRFNPSYLVKQQDYNSYEVEEKEISGIAFYYPVSGDRTGYDAFPSAPSLDGFKLIGSDIRAGFEPADPG